MLSLASQSFANGIWTITPEEPSSLALAVAGLATLAIYAAFGGWRATRPAADVDRFSLARHSDSTAAQDHSAARRAA